MSSGSRADDLVKFLEENFIPDDTLCKSIGVEYDEDAKQFLLAFLADNLSVMIVHNQTNEIIASLGLVLEYDGMPEVKLANKKLGLAAGYLNYKQEDMNVYKRYKCNKSVNLAFLCTHRQHRGNGLATTVFKAALLFAKAIGSTPVYFHGEGSALASQKIFENFEFEIIRRFKNSEYEVDGEFIFKNTGDVKELKCYVKEMH